MQFDLKSAEIPVGGYTLVLRAPTLHQHQAVIKTFTQLDGKTIMAAAAHPRRRQDRRRGRGHHGAARSRPGHRVRAARAADGERRRPAVPGRGDLPRLAGEPPPAERPCADQDRRRECREYERGPDGSTYLEKSARPASLGAPVAHRGRGDLGRVQRGRPGRLRPGKSGRLRIIGGLRTATSAVPKAPTETSTATGSDHGLRLPRRGPSWSRSAPPARASRRSCTGTPARCPSSTSPSRPGSSRLRSRCSDDGRREKDRA